MTAWSQLGFEILADKDCRLPQLTTARLPPKVDDVAGCKALLATFGIEVGGGLGPLAGTGWRFGLMGQGANERSVATCWALWPR